MPFTVIRVLDIKLTTVYYNSFTVLLLSSSGMVNTIQLALLALLVATIPAVAPQPSDLERRVADLERKMKSLDPNFLSGPEIAFAERLRVLESKMDDLLAARSGAVAPVVAAAIVPPAATAPPSSP